jgi:hypothetical protein
MVFSGSRRIAVVAVGRNERERIANVVKRRKKND